VESQPALPLSRVFHLKEKPALVAVGVCVVTQVELVFKLACLGNKLQIRILILPLELNIPRDFALFFRHDERIFQLHLEQLIGLALQKPRVLVYYVPDEAVSVDLPGLLVNQDAPRSQNEIFNVLAIR
jgi:hypothetical protein